MGTSSQYNDGAHLTILPTLLEVFFRQISYYRRKAFYEDGYGKVNQRSNFKYHPAYCINKLGDTTIFWRYETPSETIIVALIYVLIS